jgi:hypothetical protein
MGKSLDDVLRCPLNLPTQNRRIHDIDMCYPGVNARMHCVYVAMGMGTSIYW